MQEEVVSCKDWFEFKNEIIRRLFGQEPFERGIFLFRGQKDASWKLKSSFDRWFDSLQLPPDRRLGFAKSLADSFRSGLARSRMAASEQLDDRALLALGQHYGLPTRLLDWGESPYIAAYFALEDAIQQSRAGARAAVWALDTRHYIWSGHGVSIFSGVSELNTRLRNQDGMFTLLESPAACLEDHLGPAQQAGQHWPLYKFQIPAVEARRALRDLDVMGINAIRIYPDLTGCVRNAKTACMMQMTERPNSAEV